jgi:hypothetical protein
MNPIKQSLDAHRFDGLLTPCKPFWKKQLELAVMEILIGVGIGWMIGQLIVWWFDSSLDKVLR